MKDEFQEFLVKTFVSASIWLGTAYFFVLQFAKELFSFGLSYFGHEDKSFLSYEAKDE
tara:strand:+ start:805 stop:978 length:174 start_codon:yes stop_codon:yes gene_type:complete